MTPFAQPSQLKRAFDRQNSRMKFDLQFSPLVIFLPFLCTTILALFVAFESSARVKSRVQSFNYSADPAQDHMMWMSIGLAGDNIIIKTSNNHMFKWASAGPSVSEFKSFEDFMKTWAQDHLNKTVRRGQITVDTNVAALSVDQRLTFHHIRPVIYALATAGVSRYGFETRLDEK